MTASSVSPIASELIRTQAGRLHTMRVRSRPTLASGAHRRIGGPIWHMRIRTSRRRRHGDGCLQRKDNSTTTSINYLASARPCKTVAKVRRPLIYLSSTLYRAARPTLQDCCCLLSREEGGDDMQQVEGGHALVAGPDAEDNGTARSRASKVPRGE